MLHKKWLSLNGLFAKSTQATKAKQNNNKKKYPSHNNHNNHWRHKTREDILYV